MTWHHLPDSVCPCVRAAAALTWALNLPSRALPPPVSSKLKSIPEASLPPPNQPDIFTLHRSGTTLNASAGARGAGSSTRFLRDTLVSRSAMPEFDLEKETRVIFGPTLPGSSMKLIPNGYSLKMSQGTSPLALKPCCEPYGKWAGRLRLAYSRRAKSALRMNGFGSSYWPTATAHSFAQTAENPTPAQTGGTTLPGAAELQRFWQTPVADDALNRSKGKINSRGEPKLSGQAMLWPTPSAAQDTKGAQASAAAVLRRIGIHQIGLADSALILSHPVRETNPHGLALSKLRRIWRPLRAWLIASYGRADWRRLWASRDKQRLNPIFVEWLMGWPPGHALCDCSAMEWFHWRQRMRSKLLAMPTASGAWIWKPPDEAARPMKQGNLFD